MIKKIYKVGGMHCTSCAMVIEEDLADAGVKAQCSYAKETVEIEFDETMHSDEKIREVVKKAGYKIF